MTRGATFVDRVRERVERHPERTAFVYQGHDGEETARSSFADVDRRARAVAAHLRERTEVGDRALLLHPTGPELIAGFLGCLYAGVVPCPLPPPEGSRAKRTLPRLLSVARDAGAALALTVGEVASLLERRGLDLGIELVATDAIPDVDVDVDADLRRPVRRTADDLAYLQYTSGSIADPKGVRVDHGNLVAACDYNHRRWDFESASGAINWMPSYHDFGLVFGYLQPLFSGVTTRILSPLAFLRRPLGWLAAISEHRLSHAAAPNFGYDYAVDRVGEAERHGLDLGCWRVACTGAEVIRHRTLERFAAAFAPHGFRRRAFYPSYGLAEATLLVTTKEAGTEPVTRRVDGAEERTAVGSGRAAPPTSIEIVDPESRRPCPPGSEGEVWVAGPSVARGYWRGEGAEEGGRDEGDGDVFRARLAGAEGDDRRFLRTGDLGFVVDGELFVGGRLAERIIVRGSNHAPQDLEQTVEESHPLFWSHGSAAFSFDDGEMERPVVVAEVAGRPAPGELAAALQAARTAVVEAHDLQLHDLVPIRRGTLPRTASGKVQRSSCRAAYLAGEVERLAGTGAPVAAPRDGGDRLEGILRWLRDYASSGRLRPRLMDERRTIPPPVVLDLGNRGLLGLRVAEELGGAGLGHAGIMRVLEQLGAIDVTLALFVVMQNALGLRPLLRHAPAPLRHRLLPRLASGRELVSFAVTEPGAGSNPRALRTRAVPLPGGGFRLHGTKLWSGSSSWAGTIHVFAQQLDDAGTPVGITGFVVRHGAPGLRMGAEAMTLGIRGMVQNAIHLEGVEVGAGDVLGTPGQGMAVAWDAMMYTRLCLAAVSLGSMRRCLRWLLRYARRRRIATGRLADHPAVRRALAEHTAAVTAVELLVGALAERLDGGCEVDDALYTTCKIVVPELAWRAVDDTLQLLGGRGYTENNLVPQWFRDARGIRIFEGPTETLRSHLGSRAVRREEGWVRLLQELGGDELAERLDALVTDLEKRCQASDAAFPERPESLHWQWLVAGEVAARALLLAVVRTAVERRPSEAGSRAAEWCRARFEESLADARRPSAAERVMLDAAELERLVDGYADAVGELEPPEGGYEELEVDPLLRAEPPAALVAEPAAAMPTATEPTATEPSSARSDFPAEAAETAEVEQWLEEWLQRELRLGDEPLDPDRPFASYGLDSVTAVELAMAVEERWGRELDESLIWDHPTVARLAAFLASETEAAPPAEPKATETDDAEPKAMKPDDTTETDDELEAQLLREIELLTRDAPAGGSP